jgi:acyl-CoA thioesterase
LTADAREVALQGRTGVYDITVTNQDKKTVAVMRGRSFTQKGKHVVAL